MGYTNAGKSTLLNTLTDAGVLGAKVGLFDTVLKFALYFVHERAWERIRFGRRGHTDYQI